jgi:hypothetical protein
MPMSTDEFAAPPGAFEADAGLLPTEPAIDVDFPLPPPDAFDAGAGLLPGKPVSAGVTPRLPSVAPTPQPESPPFVMVEEEFYSHPRYEGLLALVIFDPSGFFADMESTRVACVKVQMPIGDRTLIFPLESLPVGEWVSLTDDEQRTIPLDVYFDGYLRVLGRWT